MFYIYTNGTIFSIYVNLKCFVVTRKKQNAKTGAFSKTVFTKESLLFEHTIGPGGPLGPAGPSFP